MRSGRVDGVVSLELGHLTFSCLSSWLCSLQQKNAALSLRFWPRTDEGHCSHSSPLALFY